MKIQLSASCSKYSNLKYNYINKLKVVFFAPEDLNLIKGAPGVRRNFLNLELSKTLPTINAISQKVSLFYDVATATMQDSSFDEEFERRTLQDMGLGYQINYKDFFAKSYMAWKLGADDVISEPAYNSRFLFQTGLVF